MVSLFMVCLSLGFLARRLDAVPPQTPRVLNGWVLFVSLPALVLETVHRAALEPRVFVGAAVLWALFGLSAGGAVLAVRRGWATRSIAGAFALSVGLGNTAFVGVPLIEALGGSAAIAPAALLDQLGSFLAFSLGAVPFAMAFSGAHVRPAFVLRRLITFPPFIALVLAFALRPIAFPDGLTTLLHRFSEMLTPLALVSIGWQLDLAALKQQAKPLALGLSWKLVVAPAVMLLVVLVTTGAPLTLTDKVAVAQAAMAPMVTAAVLAAEHGLAASLSAALAAVGAVISFATVPAWWALTERLG